MTRIRVRIAAVLTGLSATIVFAQGNELGTIRQRAPEFMYLKDDGKAVDNERVPFPTDLRGRLVVMMFWRSSSQEAMQWLKDVNGLVTKHKDEGARLVTFALESKESAEKALTEVQLDVSRTWYGTGTRGANIAYAALSQPYIVLIDPLGRIAWRGHPADRLEERMLDVLALTPAYGANSAWVGMMLKNAERAIDGGELARGFTLAHQVALSTDCSSADREKAVQLMQKAGDGAKTWLEQAVKMEREGNPDEAARIVAEISVRFERGKPMCDGDPRPSEPSSGSNENSGDRTARQAADNEIGRMNASREMKEKIRDALKNVRGQVDLEQAELLEELNQFDEAIDAYRQIVEKYEDSKPAEDAQKSLDRLLKDPAAREKVAQARTEELAAVWLDIGDRFLSIKQPEQAKEQFSRILEQAPKTIAAKRAKERLEELAKSVDAAKP